ncbi:hypothetical protein LO772_26930 [Yinghuangia sp. ASG 101]|uniref:hypothetical protein n=1 Tax=Yinghuangia sp. ASG 101 TaxID=2896848 RepID=UPI001E2E8397|nr:hypothetical protein [Yinghuangia sp. ASG 101]UGQ10453.1 hypothetical protein LO772_26930 [Yinghuangia sp. ASG 101]
MPPALEGFAECREPDAYPLRRMMVIAAHAIALFELTDAPPAPSGVPCMSHHA